MSEATLAFLLDAPLQSWGSSSRFQRRETESWPTKSALVGLLAAALGIDKNDPGEAGRLAPLAALRFSALRWPKPSPALRLADFHTIGGGWHDQWQADKKNLRAKLHIPRKAGDGSPFGTVITRRTYLSDARFVLLFQGARDLLNRCAAALEDPVWGVWFGRKACLPASPLAPVVAADASAALAALALRLGIEATDLAQLEGVTEDSGPDAIHIHDVPLSFGLHHGPNREPYASRPCRRLAPGELP